LALKKTYGMNGEQKNAHFKHQNNQNKNKFKLSEFFVGKFLEENGKFLYGEEGGKRENNSPVTPSSG